MLRCCVVCKVEASPDLQLQYCSRCQSALYCSEVCQKKDWSKQHKKLCKLLNVGHGDMQLRSILHMSYSSDLKEFFETQERMLNEDDKRFFKLFQESTFEGSRGAARKMKNYAKKQTKRNQKFMLFHSLYLLVHTSNSEMLSWPNSPLLVLLQFVDPSVLSGSDREPLQEGETRRTLLSQLADLAHPFDYSTHANQLILARQLIEQHGANVNAVSIPYGETPLHRACYSRNVTNLDFIELLLKEGADPNFQDNLEMTPLMMTIPDAPGAAKFLLNWPITDANITTRSGESFVARVRRTVKHFTHKIALPANPYQVQEQFLLQRWKEIEEMLMERGAHDSGIIAIE
jgi:hypothetical protein